MTVVKNRILVVGGGYYAQPETVAKPLDFLRQWFARDCCIIVGNETMADRHIKAWAHSHGYCCLEVGAAKRYYDKSALHERDRWYLKYTNPDLVVVLPGTQHLAQLLKRAEGLGIDLYHVPGL